MCWRGNLKRVPGPFDVLEREPEKGSLSSGGRGNLKRLPGPYGVLEREPEKAPCPAAGGET
eukprot:3889345-Pyramimonas_sp.AAC.1